MFFMARNFLVWVLGSANTKLRDEGGLKIRTRRGS
jgi:hypothetical protein